MPYQRKIIVWGCISAATVFVAGILIIKHPEVTPLKTNTDIFYPLDQPKRAEPNKFPSDTNMPRGKEYLTSGSIDLKTFSPENDLVRIEDKRVWWESDNDKNDTEDDHLVNKALEEPLRRLIELVDQNGGKLEVHDAYRAKGIHNSRSMHKEGRAVDLVCDEFSMEKLAKLCWAAGFDWVLNEGSHIHCSVKRNNTTPAKEY